MQTNAKEKVLSRKHVPWLAVVILLISVGGAALSAAEGTMVPLAVIMAARVAFTIPATGAWDGAGDTRSTATRAGMAAGMAWVTMTA